MISPSCEPTYRQRVQLKSIRLASHKTSLYRATEFFETKLAHEAVYAATNEDTLQLLRF